MQSETAASMRQRIDGDIQSQLLAIFGADAFANVAGIIGAERAAEAVLAHDCYEISLVKQAFKLDIAWLIKAADAVDFVKRTVDQVIVGDGLNFFAGENAPELAAPCPRKFRIVTAA